MRTFDGNLDAYHALNALNDIYVKGISARLRRASTFGEIESISQESKKHSEEQGELYKELGEEMAQIMSKKWWQFWK